MAILAISPGWKEMTPGMPSQMRLPLISWPTRGSMGDSKRTKPAIMSVYL